jgi:hypothetical protein
MQICKRETVGQEAGPPVVSAIPTIPILQDAQMS